MIKILKKSKKKIFCGVCSGLAEYLDTDPTIIRLIALLLVFWGFSGVLLYIILALLMPSADEVED